MSESITRIKAFNLVRTMLNGMETQDDAHARLFATLTEEASAMRRKILSRGIAEMKRACNQCLYTDTFNHSLVPYQPRRLIGSYRPTIKESGMATVIQAWEKRGQ